MNLSSISLRKISFWLLPPIFNRFYDYLYLKILGQSPLNKNTYSGQAVLTDLKAKKFSYFFDERVIEEFCDEMSKDNKLNRPIETKNSENQVYLNDLVENGVCVIRGLFDKEIVNQEHTSLTTLLDPLKARTEELVAEQGEDSGLNVSEEHFGLKTDFELMSKIMRVWGIDRVQKNLALFKEDATVLDICRSYFGGNMGSANLYAEYKYDSNSYDPNFQLHSDSPFRQLKVFMLLNDIGEENAPLVYYRKSHKVEDWRVMKDLIDFTNYNKKYNFSFGFGKLAMTKMAKKFPHLTSPEMLVTGKAGDVIICETRGVHGGSPLLEGHRLQLGMVFQALGTADIGNISSRVKSLTANSVSVG
ncbi:phytanoyl-CoA dioxygenase family protein [Gammaproteobacteria bacterium]|nr:phytanoyl-CoA dioxygenase family protein [Gammaproteobacteria bacterium]